MKKILIIVCSMLTAWLPNADAQYWVTYQPGKQRQTVQPLIDQPMRDAFIARAPDSDGGTGGTWYLTGTPVQEVSVFSVQCSESQEQRTKNQKPLSDGSHSSGIHLWRSSDLKNWTPLGAVHALGRGKAAESPEIHFIDGDVYIPYAVPGWGTGLLKSKTGKPEGPYEDLGRIAAQGGGDPSLFEDDDGSVYWLWGEGWIASMKKDMSGLAGPPVSLLAKITNDGKPNFMRQRWQKSRLGGSFLCKVNGRYLLTFDTRTTRQTGPCHDSIIASSENLMGPYERPLIFVNHSGQTCIFPTGKKTWAATCSGPDTWSSFRDRPGMVPLYWEDSTKTFMRVRGDYYTEMGDFHEVKPIKVKSGADPEMLHAPDGYYYYIASAIEKGKLLLYRSKTLDTENDWEEILVDTGESIAANPAWPAEEPHGRHRLEDPRKVNIWEGSFMLHRNRLYIGAGLLAMQCQGGMKTGIGLWRSPEGQFGGPFDFVGKIAANDGLSFFSDPDTGKAYLLTGFGGLRAFKDDMSGLDPDSKHSLVWSDGSQINHDCGYHLAKIDGKYVKQIIYYFGSYSSAYGVSDTIEGPYHFQGVCMPHGGNSPLFQDRNGKWWMLGWGNTDYCVPFDGSSPFMQAMTVEADDGEIVIRPDYKK